MVPFINDSKIRTQRIWNTKDIFAKLAFIPNAHYTNNFCQISFFAKRPLYGFVDCFSKFGWLFCQKGYPLQFLMFISIGVNKVVSYW